MLSKVHRPKKTSKVSLKSGGKSTLVTPMTGRLGGHPGKKSRTMKNHSYPKY